MIEMIVAALRPYVRKLPAPMKAALANIYARVTKKQRLSWTPESQPAAAYLRHLGPAADAAGQSGATPAAETDIDAGESQTAAGKKKTRLNIAKHAGMIDLIISPNEISFAHGTGVLLSRLVEGRDDLVAIRSRTNYGGMQRINSREDFVLPDGMSDRKEIFAQVGEWLHGYDVRSILCTPFFETDVTIAIAAQAITGAPLGLWIMDDNCLNNTGIRREVMAEGFERATALFAISTELKRYYQTEFRKPMATLPPLVAPSMIRTTPAPPPKQQRFVMIGNVWSADILDRASRAIQEAGLRVEWFSSNPLFWSGAISVAQLASRGVIIVEGGDPDVVSETVAAATAVIVPSDPGDAGSHEKALGAMSLPTRMPFVLATAGTPMIVLGHAGTAAAAFVERFKIGRVVPYEGAALLAAVNELSAAAEQKVCRANAASVAGRFSFAGAADFVFKTILGGGRWIDERFESLLAPKSDTFGYYFDKPAPVQFAAHFGEVVALCDRLRNIGFEPDFVLDIGASTAIWSNAVSSVYANSRYILCDPMFSRYPNVWTKPGFELIEAAISDKPGNATFSVSSDLYGSSLISVSKIVAVVDKINIPVRTIDDVAAEKKLTGRGLLKIDVQFAEHLVVEGALRTLKEQVDVVVLELTLVRVHGGTKTLLEMCNRMNALGFRIFDQVGNWRVPTSGELEQLDVVFVRKGLPGTFKSVPAESRRK